MKRKYRVTEDNRMITDGSAYMNIHSACVMINKLQGEIDAQLKRDHKREKQSEVQGRRVIGECGFPEGDLTHQTEEVETTFID